MAPPSSRGIFATTGDAMTAFLARVAATKTDPGAFVARNFLLDENVQGPRHAGYVARKAGAGAHAALGDWYGAHNEYFWAEVSLPNDDTPPMHLDASDTLTCPETFRHRVADSPYAAASTDCELIRLEDISDLETRIKGTGGRFKTALERQVGGTLDGAGRRELDRWLATLARHSDLRPVFSALWSSVEDLFATDAPHWASTLRDRLGLAHYDPVLRSRPIDVVVFRYPVRALPTLGRSGPRPLVPPTVLDGRPSDAFCPAPLGCAAGYTVDLEANSHGVRERCEVLHPAFTFSSAHVFQIGRIERGVNLGTLPEARAIHLEQVRDEHKRPDYAQSTDGDL